MTPTPHTIGLEQTLETASRIMREHGIRHLPVLHGGELRGILSVRDVYLLETLDDVDAARVTVEEAMTAEPYAVEPDTDLREVVEAMREHKYGAAVVMEGRHSVGIFTTIDALQVLSDYLARAE